MSNAHSAWSLVCHLIHSGRGTAAVLKGEGEHLGVEALRSASATGLPAGRTPIYVGLNADGRIVLLDPASQALSLRDALPEDAAPLYAYPGAQPGEWWYVNDGDEAGNDDAVCGGQGSPVMILRHTSGSGNLVKTLCVGRGHHVVAFSEAPRKAFVSDLLDGTIRIFGFDANDPATYLQCLATINLYDGAREQDGVGPIPNNAFPHGMVYSPTTRKIYNLNNGYATVVAIDPQTHEAGIIGTMKGSSNLLLSPCGRYLLGKGADRKSNAEHVLGKLMVMDTGTGEVVSSEEILDFYPSTYRFNVEGTKLYVTSAGTGKGVQKDNLKMNVLRVYNATAFPQLELLREVTVGQAECGRRPFAFLTQHGKTRYILMPNPTDGTLTVLNGDTDQAITTLTVGEGRADEVNFGYWGSAAHGC